MNLRNICWLILFLNLLLIVLLTRSIGQVANTQEALVNLTGQSEQAPAAYSDSSRISQTALVEVDSQTISDLLQSELASIVAETAVDARIINTTLRLQYRPQDFNQNLPTQALKSRLDKILIPTIRLLSQPHISAYLKAVSIESHAADSKADSDTYQQRFEASKRRTSLQARSIYQYLFSLNQLEPQREWMTKHLQAFGRSFSHPVLNHTGQQDRFLSRRIDLVIALKS